MTITATPTDQPAFRDPRPSVQHDQVRYSLRMGKYPLDQISEAVSEFFSTRPHLILTVIAPNGHVHLVKRLPGNLPSAYQPLITGFINLGPRGRGVEHGIGYELHRTNAAKTFLT